MTTKRAGITLWLTTLLAACGGEYGGGGEWGKADGAERVRRG